MNKGYIKVVFFVLSLFVYVDNRTHATEPASRKGIRKNPPTKVAPSKSSTDKANSDSIILENDDLDEIYEQNKNLLCKYPEETKKVTKVMDEAIATLKEYATTEDGYVLSYNYDNNGTKYYKQHGKAEIGKLILNFPDSDRYNEIINILWDPNGAKIFDPNFIEGKVIRVYNPNLAMIQKRYNSPELRFQGYFYALTKKIKVSEDTTIIVFASANIDDHNSKDKEKYTNPILKEINTYKTYINSDNYIRCGKLKKTFVNLSGFLIEKKDKHIDITCIISMDYRVSPFLSYVAKNVMLGTLTTFINLKQLLLKK